MVELQPSKLAMRVRFPSPALYISVENPMVTNAFDYPRVTNIDHQCPLFRAQTMPDYAQTMPEGSSREEIRLFGFERGWVH